MKTILLASIITLFAITCANNNRNGIPAKYFPLLDNALARAGANRHALEQAIEQASAIEREGVAFLIAYMPESDLTSMSTTDLLINVKLAYTARERFSWARSVPDSIFLNDISPTPASTSGEKTGVSTSTSDSPPLSSSARPCARPSSPSTGTSATS